MNDNKLPYFKFKKLNINKVINYYYFEILYPNKSQKIFRLISYLKLLKLLKIHS